MVHFSDGPPTEISLPSCPLNNTETDWSGWYTVSFILCLSCLSPCFFVGEIDSRSLFSMSFQGIDKKLFERDVKDTIKAYKRAKRDQREVPPHLCFRGIEDHLSSRHQHYRKAQIHSHIKRVLQEQARLHEGNKQDDENGQMQGVNVSYKGFCLGDGVVDTSEWALERALTLGNRDAVEARLHLMDETVVEEKQPTTIAQTPEAAEQQDLPEQTEAATALQTVEEAARVIAAAASRDAACARKNAQWPMTQIKATESSCVIPLSGRAA